MILLSAACYQAQAQTETSSRRNAQTQTITGTETPSSPASPSSATMVSGQKQATVKEVPAGAKETEGTTTATPVSAPSSKKPD